MALPVLVTGGTGRLGRPVVRRLGDAGCDVRVLSRRGHGAGEGIRFFTGDLRTGEGVDLAVAGAAAVVHCASSTKGDVEATRNLIQAASRAGSPHLLHVSIVGVDQIASWGYVKVKLRTERLVADSGLPWTILRATQFYDYILSNIEKMTRLPIAPVPAGFRVRPVDPEEVAARLVELTLAGPAGRVPDISGPQVTDWAGLIRDYLRATGRHRWVIPVRIPGTRAVRAGGLLPPAGHTIGQRTWQEFLTANLSPQSPTSP